MTRLLRWLRSTVTGKIVFIAFLVLVLLIPLGMVESRIAERGAHALEARRDIENTWGTGQVVAGPVLILPRLQSSGGVRYRRDSYWLPTSLAISVSSRSQTLARGIFDVPVYTASVRITGTIEPPADGSAGSWSDALLSLPASDPRAIREPVEITVDQASATFRDSGMQIPGLGPQLVVALPDLGIDDSREVIDFVIDYTIGGTANLGFLPFGDTTRIELRSDWPSPSFGGAYLPDAREISDDGFTATWNVLGLGRGYPSSWTRRDDVDAQLAERIRRTRFGVEMIVPIGPHEMSLRATKYSVLFLCLTFSTFFLFELLVPLRLHGLQYLLVGFANSIFYLLLIALSEHVAFQIAYVLSAAGSIGLIGGYSISVLGGRERALPVTLLLVAIYAYLYFTLRLEDYALLSGSLGLFVILGGVMYFTRRVDWHEMNLRKQEA